MKKGFIHLFCFLIPTLLSAQINFKNELFKKSVNTIHSNLYKNSVTKNYTSLFPEREINLKYKTPKLPFFCSMEEKSRNKFHVFLKLRAGNDESYLKLIKSSEK